MRCARVRRLLPLYVGGDLDAKRARAIFEHTRSCEECAAADAAFDASRRLLSRHMPPDFDEEFFASIRRSVLEEIATPASTRSALAILFGRRRRFALATLAALLVSSVTLTVLRSEPREVAERAPVAIVPPDPGRDVAPPRFVEDTQRGPEVRNHPARPKPVVRRARARSSEPPLAAQAAERPPEVQKIEIMTADPNIRIIWFAPKREGANLGAS